MPGPYRGETAARMRGHWRLRRCGRGTAAQASHDGKSTAVGDQPNRDGSDEPRVPGRSRARADQPGAQPVTVEQLLARQGGPATGRRRAARRGGTAPDDTARGDAARGEAPRLRAPEAPPAGTRGGLPPVPG